MTSGWTDGPGSPDGPGGGGSKYNSNPVKGGNGSNASDDLRTVGGGDSLPGASAIPGKIWSFGGGGGASNTNGGAGGFPGGGGGGSSSVSTTNFAGPGGVGVIRIQYSILI